MLLANQSTDNNEIASLPSEIGQLTNLRRLYYGTCRVLKTSIILPFLSIRTDSQQVVLPRLFDTLTGGNNITSDDFPQELVVLCSAISCRG